MAVSIRFFVLLEQNTIFLSSNSTAFQYKSFRKSSVIYSYYYSAIELTEIAVGTLQCLTDFLYVYVGPNTTFTKIHCHTRTHPTKL